MPGERKRQAEARNPPARGTMKCAMAGLHNAGPRGNRATGLARCASNAAVLYFSRRRPRGLSASGFFILVALPVPGKVYFYRAEIQVGTDLNGPDLLAVDGKSAPKSLPHKPSGGLVSQ